MEKYELKQPYKYSFYVLLLTFIVLCLAFMFAITNMKGKYNHLLFENSKMQNAITELGKQLQKRNDKINSLQKQMDEIQK